MEAVNDIKYAVRLLLKKPGFTILTMLVMAAGIGLSIYLFSFFNVMVFKDLPFEDGESLIVINASQNGSRSNGQINLHDYYEIRTNLQGVSEFGAYYHTDLNVSGRDGARRHIAVAAEPNIFQLTRTKPILGREFTEADNRIGAEKVVVVGYDVWQNQFAGDEHVIGQMLRINGENHRVVGVMPRGYLFPIRTEMWIPMRHNVAQSTRDNTVSVHGLAHLEEGVSLEAVNQQLALIMSRIEERYPKTNTGVSAYADSIPRSSAQDGISVVYAMQFVAVLILILASVNVGNLLLSRAIERGKETAIRVAIGAPRSRLISQMLWESIIICSIGGVIGLLVVAWGLEVTRVITGTFFIDGPAFWWKFGIDGFTLKLFVFFVLITILMTGLLPAWRNSGTDFNAVLRDGTRGALSKKAGRLNQLLVKGEIFISMTVVIAASIMVVAAYMQAHADYGSDTKNTLTAVVSLSESTYDTPEKQIQFVRALQSRLENSTGIGDVMLSSALPGAPTFMPKIALEGREYTKDRGFPRANHIVVTPGSLAKLGIELKQGRYFNGSDEGQDKRSAIVTDTFVSRHFPNESAIGKRLRVVDLDGDEPNWVTIVGVVEHTYQGSPTSEQGRIPTIFRPFAQAPSNWMTVALRMESDRSEIIRTLRKTLQTIDPELPAFRVETYSDFIARSAAPIRFISTIFLLFGIAAIIFAASGIYGVMSNTINQRTQEIGVKRALGAWEQRITKEFLITGLKHLLWGGLPGLAAGCALGYVMSVAFGGHATLLIIALTITAIIGFVVMFATYLPTKRALKMEPSEALHYE